MRLPSAHRDTDQDIATMTLGSIRHHIRINRPADTVWALAGDPTRLHEWFPGISLVPGRRQHPHDRARLRSADARGDLGPRPRPASLPVPDNGAVFTYHRGGIDVIDLGDETCVVVYTTDCDPRPMALTIGGARRARSTSCGDRWSRARTEDTLMGRKILFVTSDQQRYDTLRCNGGSVARTPVIDGLAADGPSLRARSSAVGRVHAVAIDDHHRSASEHARCVDERRRASGRRPIGGRGLARRRLPHRADRQAALRAVPRPVCPLHREPLRSPRLSDLHRGFEHFETATHGALGPLHYARWLAANHPEAVGMFYPVLDGAWRSMRKAEARRVRRRCTTTPSRGSGTTPTGSPIARSRGSIRSTPTTTGSAG